MMSEAVPAHLSHLLTVWPEVLAAKGGRDSRSDDARGQLLVRYHEAVYLYLLRKLGNPHAAGEVYSDFALRVLEDERLLRSVDPERGRFRDYLKTVLFRMAADYWRKQQKNKTIDLPPEWTDEEEQWQPIWKQELLNQVWKELEKVEINTGQPYASVVRLKEEQPELRSHHLAEQLSEKMGRSFTAENIRKIIQRGRELFADLLVAEVARTLKDTPDEVITVQQIEDELIDLELYLSYCKEALKRYAEKA
jgi:RNA polymerase sigma-70 factor (ECF subfamily)